MVPRVGCWIRQAHQDWFVRSGWLGDRGAGWAWGVGCCWVPAEDAGMTGSAGSRLGMAGCGSTRRFGDFAPAHHERLGMGDGRKAGFVRGLRNDKGRDGVASRIAGVRCRRLGLCGGMGWRCMGPGGWRLSMCGRLRRIRGRRWLRFRAGGPSRRACRPGDGSSGRADRNRPERGSEPR